MGRKKQDNITLEVVHPICCGVDVHKKELAATVIFIDEDGRNEVETVKFGTMTEDIIRFRDWLKGHNCTIVAIESTGVYWRPVHNLLEGHMEVILVNARHYKNLRGKKTDIKDSHWLANLLRHGLLKGSFIPPHEVRQWRDLVGYRGQLVSTLGDFKRRVHKLFETANIKIDSVVTDLFGVTGRNLMAILAQKGTTLTFEDVRGCLRGSLKKKEEELYAAVQGFFTDHHRFILNGLLKMIGDTENQIERANDRLSDVFKGQAELIQRLDEIPGVDQVGAWSILANIGPDLEAFPTSGHLCSWAGLCPGNNESAGKQGHGSSPVKKHKFKTLMVELAWAGVKKKGSYYKDKYYRLKARRGAKRAIVAIAHRMTKAIYNIIKYGDSYRELGDEYLVQRNKKVNMARLARLANQYGFELTPIP